MNFEQFDIGDMFNTKVARFVKVDENRAIVVMSGILEIGMFVEGQMFGNNQCIPIYTKQRWI